MMGLEQPGHSLGVCHQAFEAVDMEKPGAHNKGKDILEMGRINNYLGMLVNGLQISLLTWD